MAAFGSNQARQRDTNETTVRGIETGKRGRPIERSAAGVLDDVVEEAARTRFRAVLVVDPAIDVGVIGESDQLRGGILVMVRPLFDIHRLPDGGLAGPVADIDAH